MIRFTKDEKIILIFLLAALFIGISVSSFKRLNPNRKFFIEFNEKEIEESKKVNINIASKERFMTLPGIGPVMAERIISYREQNGSFEKAEDIKNVKGIGDKTFEKMKKWIILK